MELLTPTGVAGIAVFRVVGDERHRLASVLQARGGGAFTLRPGAPPKLASLVLDGVVVDEVLVVDRGRHGVELHTHGAPAVVAAVRGSFALAAPEPSVAHRLAREAMSNEQLDLAVEQASVDFDTFCSRLRSLPPPERREALRAARHRSVVAMALAVPCRVVLMGAQNAGKSTLFNALLSRERVLTGSVPGLTRDTVEERTVLAGYPYEIVDAAGEGDAESTLDRRAIVAARAAREGASRILVVDSSIGPSAVDRSLAPCATFVVATKSDLPAAPWPDDVPKHLDVSCFGDHGSIRSRLGTLLRSARGLPAAGPVGGPAALTEEQLRRLAAEA